MAADRLALAGQSAVVTGASRGIGRAIAGALAAGGARVALLARQRAALEALAAELPTPPGAPDARPLVVPCDLTQPNEVTQALTAIADALGAPDLLVLNAGVFAIGAVGELPPAETERMLQLSIAAPYRLLHGLLPDMRARGRGHVVTIGSVADRVAFPENAGYAAAKFGARAMHEVLRQELRGSGVRASLISPGPTDTPIWDPINPDARPGYPSRREMLNVSAVAEAVFWVVTRAADVNIDELRLSRA